MKVLIIAEEANPEWVSVPLVGWSTASAIAKVVDAHIVTQIRNEAAFFRAGWPASEFTVINNESVAGPLWRLASALRGGEGRGWTTLAAFKAFAYRSFEKIVWQRFGSAIKGGQYDVVHRVTPLSPAIPSLIARRTKAAGMPFVWGPVNGGLPWPREFRSARHAEREWMSYLRWAHRFMPGYRSTRSSASAIIVASQATLNQMPHWCRDRCIYLPENGVDGDRLLAQRRQDKPASDCLRLIFVGRLVPYKGCDMAIESAAPLLRSGRASIDIIGDGPERSGLEDLARSLHVRESVRFRGWLPHAEVYDWLLRSDVLVFPSIREFGGGAVLEAMAAGCVPLVVDYGGPGELVTPDSGIKVSIGSREDIVASVARSISKISDYPESLGSMRVAGIDRVRASFTWEARAQQVRRVYDWVLYGGAKPDFGLLR